MFEGRKNRFVGEMKKGCPLLVRELARWLAAFYVRRTRLRQRHRGRLAEALPVFFAGSE